MCVSCVYVSLIPGAAGLQLGAFRSTGGQQDLRSQHELEDRYEA